MGTGSALRDIWQRDSNVAVQLGMEDLRRQNSIKSLAESFKAKQDDADRTRGILEASAKAERSRQESNMQSQNLGMLMGIAGQDPAADDLDNPYTLQGYVEARRQLGDVEGKGDIADLLMKEVPGLTKKGSMAVVDKNMGTAMAIIGKGGRETDWSKELPRDARASVIAKGIDVNDKAAVGVAVKEWYESELNKASTKTSSERKKYAESQLAYLYKQTGAYQYKEDVDALITSDPELKDAVDEFSGKVDPEKLRELMHAKWGGAKKDAAAAGPSASSGTEAPGKPGGKKAPPSEFDITKIKNPKLRALFGMARRK